MATCCELDEVQDLIKKNLGTSKCGRTIGGGGAKPRVLSSIEVKFNFSPHVSGVLVSTTKLSLSAGVPQKSLNLKQLISKQLFKYDDT